MLGRSSGVLLGGISCELTNTRLELLGMRYSLSRTEAEVMGRVLLERKDTQDFVAYVVITPGKCFTPSFPNGSSSLRGKDRL